MKRQAIVFLLLSLLFLSMPTATAAAARDTEAQIKEGVGAVLPDLAKPYLPSPTDADAVSEALGFRALFSLVANALGEQGGLLRGRVGAVLGLTLCLAALSLLCRGGGGERLLECAAALGFFALLWDTAERAFAFFSDLRAFTVGLSPLFISLFAGGGGTAGAAAASGGFSAFLSLLSLFSTTLLPPLLRALFALALLSALGNHVLIRELSRRLCGIATTLFSVLSMLLLSSLAFQSILASSADSMALRAIKYTASSAVPLVGSTVSGALGALHASLSLLKSALGGTAVVALLSLLLPPLAEVFLLRLALSISESIAAFSEAAPLGSILSRFRSIMDLLLATLIIVSLLFLLMVGIFTTLSPTA